MNYYGYSGKKSKHRSNRRTLIIRIIIIVLAIVGSVTFALVLGNNLKKKLDDSDVSKEPVENIIPDETGSEEEELDLVLKKTASFEELSMTGGYLDLKDCPDAKSAESFVFGLKAAGYTGLIFDVKDENGKLTYSSKAVSELVGAETVGSVTDTEKLFAALNAASAEGLKSCAFVELSGTYTGRDESVLSSVDTCVIGELAQLGFDRIVLSGVFGEDFSADAVNGFFDYMDTLKGEAPDVYFGVVLAPSVFEKAELTPALELLFRYTDFFVVDFSDSEVYSQETVAAFKDKFSGSLSAYRINVLLDGATEENIRSYYQLFLLNGANVSFITPKTDYKAEKDEDGQFLYSSKIPKYSVVEEEKADEDTKDMEKDED